MKRRILLADDDLAILLTLKAVLEINGFDVETASSAREARQKLRAHDYHMVITDLRMESEAAGLEVVAAARQAKCNPAVAVLTAFPEDDAEEESGAHKMLVKPIHTADLLRQLEALLVAHEDHKHQPKRGEAVRELAVAASKPKQSSAAKRRESVGRRKSVAKATPEKVTKKTRKLAQVH